VDHFAFSHSTARARLRRAAGVLLLAFGYLLLPVALITAARFAVTASTGIRIIVAIAGLAAAVAYIRWHRRAIRWGRRLLTISAEEVLQSDQPFVVYLRSFRDEDLPSTKPTLPIGARLAAYDERLGERPEERLIIVAQGIGPMVALGRPGDLLPPIGAARIYIPKTSTDDEWQSVVQDLCQRASMVIVKVSAMTPGLLWEIQNVPRFIHPERLIIYMPRDRDSQGDAPQQGEFLTRYGEYFPKKLPRDPGDARCLIFDAEWNPTPIGPWSLPIRSAVGILAEKHHGLLSAPAGLGLNEDTLSILSAVERNFPEYRLPLESQLPFDLQVNRAFDLLFGLFGKLGAAAALLVILWPESIHKAQDWLSQWW
jgi:hypothetical protein